MINRLIDERLGDLTSGVPIEEVLAETLTRDDWAGLALSGRVLNLFRPRREFQGGLAQGKFRVDSGLAS